MLRSRDAPASAGAFWRFQKRCKWKKYSEKHLRNVEGFGILIPKAEVSRNIILK